MRSRGLGVMILSLSLLAACSGEPPVTAPVVNQGAHPKIPVQNFAPGLADEVATTAPQQPLNDPSAPLTTPLCGTALHEVNQVGAIIYPQGLATTTSSCAQNACFEPLTGTFIAADGNRSVCR
ncbi:hypothetical protein [Swingsia samuiensis]|uniref:Lectin-like protein BA14k n=1 Tax=Swingsia samuiensis TaxID=1293412 RepID=A0A4Y6UIM6_9PROT|nr:hypothetical protein [Swingsia samuiensis]QDH17453.1 hypothetical protein E3D00_07675 [Swingsia samuiensis]